MSKPTRQGRKPISTYCVDCFREVQTGTRSPEDVGAKQYGSYCGTHMNKRHQKYQTKRTANTFVVRGEWADLPDSVVEFLAENNAAQVASNAYGTVSIPARTNTMAKAVALAFEYGCVQGAIDRSRRMTRAEEDEVIARFHGVRCGTGEGYPVRWVLAPGLAEEIPVTHAVPVIVDGRVIGLSEVPERIQLPDPLTRLKFRAQMRGGPTTVGEPEFHEYYEQQFGHKAPVEFVVSGPGLDLTGPDGLSIKSELLGLYRDDVANMKLGNPPALNWLDSTGVGVWDGTLEEFLAQQPDWRPSWLPTPSTVSDNDAIKSFSQLAAAAEERGSERANSE